MSAADDVSGLLRSKTVLAFAQLMCIANEGGVSVVLPPLDDMRFHVVAQVFGAQATRTLVCSRATGLCRNELHWTVDGNRFAVATQWREPTRADWFEIARQRREEDSRE